MLGYRNLALLIIVLTLGGCDWLFPRDNPGDQARCDPACGAGKVCWEGTCVLPDGAAPDAGVDTGPPDQGLDRPLDAPAPDAPVPDAPVPDAPIPDAPIPDVPIPDAPIPDVPIPDAPVPDKMLPDKTLPDMMLPDKMLPDAGTPPVCGTTWAKMKSPVTANLMGVWGSSPTDVFAVGAGGTILHYNGTKWSDMTSSKLTKAHLHAVWGSSSSDVYAVGASGTIVHYDGKKWTPEISGAASTLNAVSGRSSSQIWVVGDNGTALYSPGGGWKPQTSNTSANLEGVWASKNSSTVMAVGSDMKAYSTPSSGAASWKQHSGIGMPAAGVWGTSSSNIFAVGVVPYAVNGAIARYDGKSWNSMTHPGTAKLLGVRGAGEVVYAVGQKGQVLRYDGSKWAALGSGTSQDINAVWAGDNEMFAVGNGGLIFRHTLPWKPMPRPTKNNFLAAVWGSGPTDVYAVGGTPGDLHCSTILRYNGTSWIATPGWSCVDAVWGTGPTDVYVLNRPHKSSNTNIYRYDGKWSLFKSYGAWLYAMSGTGPKNLYFVGKQGVVGYDGLVWSSLKSGLKGYLRGTWTHSSGKTFAVGDSGTVVYFDGISWTDMTSKSKTSAGLKEVWGSSPSNVYAVGSAGTLLHYNGAAWSVLPAGLTTHLEGVWGSSATDVFVVGDEGVVLHFNGVKWSKTLTARTDKLQGVWGSSASDVFVVGDKAILHWCGP